MAVLRDLHHLSAGSCCWIDMAAASLQKAFNKLHNDHVRATDATQGAAKPVPPKTEEDKLRERTTPMTLADCIPRILLAWSDKDYFRCFLMRWCAVWCPVVCLVARSLP